MSRLTIRSNVSSLLVQRRLASTTEALQEVFTRLSSGLRINNASDDAAGLAISEALNLDRRVYNQGVRNLNDGISLLSIADGAITELSRINTRLLELAEQASNGTLSNTQRKSIDEEAQALSEEFARIARSTEFNEAAIFSGSYGELRLQAGYGENGAIISSLGGTIGTGEFGGANQLATENRRTYDVQIADLNGDGHLDMVTAGVTDASGGYLTVQLGNGSGSFSSAVSYQTEGFTSRGLTLGDINGDGIYDLVTAGYVSADQGYATVRLGDGSGSFGAATSFATESNYSLTVDLADVNGDGQLDLITAGQSDGGDGYATVRLGNGSGSFGSATSFLTEANRSFDVELVDVNGDDILDLVTAGQDDSNNGFATVQLGNGSGSFGTATSFATESRASLGLSIGDLNGDGRLDIVTAGYTDSISGSATVLLGTGNGQFSAAGSFSTEEARSWDVALGDINGDGILDVVTAGYTTGLQGYTTVRLGSGQGTFGAATSYQAEDVRSFGITLNDINRDGVLDMISAGEASGTDGEATIRLGLTTTGVAPILDFSLKTAADARQALPLLQAKLEDLAAQRGVIGAFESRASTAIKTLQVTEENLAAAASAITDADVAEEAAELVRLQILQQAGAAVLAQTNKDLELALSLLQ